MKKSGFLVAVLLMVGGTSLVFAESDEYSLQPENIRYTETVRYLFENEQAVYMYDAAHYLFMYLDETDMTWYPLCDKPDCSHTVDTETRPMQSDCNAWIDCSVSNGLVQWEDRIYYFDYHAFLNSDIALSSIKTDGSDHKTELVIEQKEGEQTLCLLHHGKAYVIRDYLGEKAALIQAYDLDSLQTEPETVWEGSEEDSFIPRFTERYMFYMDADAKSMRQDLYRMDIDGANQTLVAEDLHWGMTFIEEDCLYQYLSGTGLIMVPYETGETMIIWDDMEKYGCEFTFRYDGEFFYLWSLSGGSGLQEESPVFLILDKDGEVLEEMELPNLTAAMEEKQKELEEAEANKADNELELADEYSVMAQYTPFYGVTSKYIFAVDDYYPNYYIERSEIGSGRCEWKEIGYYEP